MSGLPTVSFRLAAGTMNQPTIGAPWVWRQVSQWHTTETRGVASVS
jgi:hypothetical protein